MAEQCVCGRSAEHLHCPACGSAWVTAYVKRESLLRDNGKLEQVRAYRCRRCSERFNDDQWRYKCHAPIPLRGAQPRRATINRLFELASLDRSATLAETASALNWLELVRREQSKDKNPKQ